MSPVRWWWQRKESEELKALKALAERVERLHEHVDAALGRAERLAEDARQLMHAALETAGAVHQSVEVARERVDEAQKAILRQETTAGQMRAAVEQVKEFTAAVRKTVDGWSAEAARALRETNKVVSEASGVASATARLVERSDQWMRKALEQTEAAERALRESAEIARGLAASAAQVDQRAGELTRRVDGLETATHEVLEQLRSLRALVEKQRPERVEQRLEAIESGLERVWSAVEPRAPRARIGPGPRPAVASAGAARPTRITAYSAQYDPTLAMYVQGAEPVRAVASREATGAGLPASPVVRYWYGPADGSGSGPQGYGTARPVFGGRDAEGAPAAGVTREPPSSGSGDGSPTGEGSSRAAGPHEPLQAPPAGRTGPGRPPVDDGGTAGSPDSRARGAGRNARRADRDKT